MAALSLTSESYDEGIYDLHVGVHETQVAESIYLWGELGALMPEARPETNEDTVSYGRDFSMRFHLAQWLRIGIGSPSDGLALSKYPFSFDPGAGFFYRPDAPNICRLPQRFSGTPCRPLPWTSSR